MPVAVRGTVSFRITNYREFVKLHRLTQFSTDDFNKQIKDAICRYIKDAVTAAPAENNIPVIQIESKIALINDKIEYDIGERLRENFGVTVSGVDINSIEIDKTNCSKSKAIDTNCGPKAPGWDLNQKKNFKNNACIHNILMIQ